MKYRILDLPSLNQIMTAGTLLLGLAFASAVDARLYAVYNGISNGVTVRDESTFEQSVFFDLSQPVNQIAAGPHRNLFVTSANSIYQFNDRGNLIGEFTFSDTDLSYGSISVGDGQFFAGVSGSQNGITVRNSRTFNQTMWIPTNYQVGRVAAGGDSDFYVTVDNVIYRYSDAGEQLGFFEFDDHELLYGAVTYSNGRIYVSYSGSQEGISVRDATSLEQVDLFSPGFTVNGIAAGENDDLYLTSGDNIYRYSTAGSQLDSFSFGNNGIDYQGISVGSGELGQAYLMTNAASSNVSSLHLINTSGQTQEFFGTVYSGDGEVLGAANGSLGSVGANVLSAAEIENIFEIGAWSGPAVIDVTGADDFNVMIKLQSPSGLISNTNCIRQGRVDNIEGSEANVRTFIRFLNMGNQTISDIAGTLFITENGMVRQSEATILSSLAPREAVWVNGDSIAQLFNETWDGAASMTVSSNSSLWLLNLNFVNDETFFNFSCYESSSE